MSKKEKSEQPTQKAKKGASVQRFLDIATIREDVAVLKDGSMRAVLAVSSINFALKSEDEQNALIAGYAQFLNSLDYPLQIVIQSRKLNIDDYLNRLKRAEKEQTNDLLRMQITDYLEFVKELVDLGEIMAKRFYAVVPYSSISDTRKGFWSRLSELLNPFTVLKIKEERFRAHRESLMRRVSHVRSGLSSLGLSVAMLDTQALIELYFKAYNPDIGDIQKLQDIGKVRVEEVGAV